jgi:hypothetical protein
MGQERNGEAGDFPGSYDHRLAADAKEGEGNAAPCRSSGRRPRAYFRIEATIDSVMLDGATPRP